MYPSPLPKEAGSGETWHVRSHWNCVRSRDYDQAYFLSSSLDLALLLSGFKEVVLFCLRLRHHLGCCADPHLS